MKKVLVTGSIAYDILLGYEGVFADVIDPKALGSLSLSFFSPRYARRHGGTGANIAWGLKLLGIDPVLVGAVGNDGDEYVKKLKSAGIITEYIQVIDGSATATAIVNTDSRENQIAFFHPGADSHGQWPAEGLPSGEIAYGIVSARDTAAMVKGMEWCGRNKIPVFFDPGQQLIAFSDDELKHMVAVSAGVFVNEYEWEILRKKINKKGLKGMEGWEGWEGLEGGESFVIVTLGDKGARIIRRGGETEIPAFKAKKIVDPTGAGDAFRAGFLAGICEGKDIEEACRLGNAMGSIAVEREGTLLEGVKRGEVEMRIRN